MIHEESKMATALSHSTILDSKAGRYAPQQGQANQWAASPIYLHTHVYSALHQHPGLTGLALNTLSAVSQTQMLHSIDSLARLSDYLVQQARQLCSAERQLWR